MTTDSVSLENLVKTFLKTGEHYLVVSINIKYEPLRVYHGVILKSPLISKQKPNCLIQNAWKRVRVKLIQFTIVPFSMRYLALFLIQLPQKGSLLWNRALFANLTKSNIFEQNSSFHLDRIAASGLLSRVQPANATHCEQDKYSGLTSIILKSLLPISHTYLGGGGLQISGRI